MSEQLIANLDAWAAQQADKPSREEALRRLIKIGITFPATRRKPQSPLIDGEENE